ncbi:hypothetical protein NA56DRAFT_753214 [Hyaloscypha hepaticicola]|uniref:Uncharacterized protein n=1 Tax=Hyaloscypha hepaticicola TaxID=2082293 RepID=A0A2J6PQP5_9HELO|nr:hypothetical protein NA56DRAFT_753214 [Hyaloscypha hepaticicola]
MQALFKQDRLPYVYMPSSVSDCLKSKETETNGNILHQCGFVGFHPNRSLVFALKTRFSPMAPKWNQSKGSLTFSGEIPIIEILSCFRISTAMCFSGIPSQLQHGKWTPASPSPLLFGTILPRHRDGSKPAVQTLADERRGALTLEKKGQGRRKSRFGCRNCKTRKLKASWIFSSPVGWSSG